MHGAGFQGRAKIAKMLIDHGLDKSDRHMRDGFTPLHRACWGREARHTDTVQIFLEAGVSPTERGSNNQLPIEMATTQETRDLLQKWMDKEQKGEL